MTIADVAMRCGVSKSTVSRVLNGMLDRASDKTIAKIRQAAADRGYRPQLAGRSLRTQKTRLVGVLVPDISNGYYAAYARSIEVTLRSNGYSMILANTEEQPSQQDENLAEMRALMVCGLVMLGVVESPTLRVLVDSGFPVVQVNRSLKFARPCPFIGIDNYAAGREIAQRFIDRGYCTVAAITGPTSSSAVARAAAPWQIALMQTAAEDRCSRSAARAAEVNAPRDLRLEQA